MWHEHESHLDLNSGAGLVTHGPTKNRLAWIWNIAENMRKGLTQCFAVFRTVAGRNSSDSLAAKNCSGRALVNSGSVRQTGSSPRADRLTQLRSWDNVPRSLAQHQNFRGQFAAAAPETELSSIRGVGKGSRSYATFSPSGAGDAEDAPTPSDARCAIKGLPFCVPIVV